MADYVRFTGWLVAETAALAESDRTAKSVGGRLFLFRDPGGWTLLSVRHHTDWDEFGDPVRGAGSAYLRSFPDLAQLKVYLQRDYRGRDEWRALVDAGQSMDRELRELWVPVQIDRDLERTSTYLRDLAEGGEGRGRMDWKLHAFHHGVRRLEGLGFVLLRTSDRPADVFGHVPDWHGNHVLGAAAVAKYGYRADVLMAIDSFGEIYARTPDTAFDPGTPRKYPPRRLTEGEARTTEETNRRRLEDHLRRLDAEDDR